MNTVLNGTENLSNGDNKISAELSSLKASLDTALNTAINQTQDGETINEITLLKQSIAMAQSQEELIRFISRLEALKSVEVTEALTGLKTENQAVLNDLKKQVASNQKSPLTRQQVAADYKNIANIGRNSSSNNVVSMIEEAKSKGGILGSIIGKLSDLA